MRQVRATLSTFCFWGVIILILWMFAFNIHVVSICYSALNGQGGIRAISVFLLAAVPIKFIMNIISIRDYHKVGVPIPEYFIDSWNLSLQQPYNGVNIIAFICMKRKHVYDSRKLFLLDLPIYFMRFFNTVIWWLLLIYGIYQIRNTPKNIYLVAVQRFTKQELIIRAFGILAGYVVALIAIKLLFKLSGKKYKIVQCEKKHRKSTYNKSKNQYYIRRSWKIPKVCFECGGNYPECKDGCPLFDD